jgi:hypothetical protein
MIMRLWSRWRRTNDFTGRICTFEYVAGFAGRIVQAILSRIRLGFLKLNKQNLYYLGEVLTQTWNAALMYEFPERHFEIQGTEDEVGRSPDSGDFVTTFWQPNPTGAGKR